MSGDLVGALKLFVTYLTVCTLVYWLRVPLMALFFHTPGLLLDVRMLPFFVEAALLPAVFGVIVAGFYLLFQGHRAWHLMPSGVLSFYLLPQSWSDEFVPTFDFYLVFGLPLYCLGALIGFVTLNRQMRVKKT